MAIKSIKHKLFYPLAFLTGAISAGYGTYYFCGNMMLWGLYMEAAKNSTIYISVINDLNKGNSESAIQQLNNYLQNSEAILRGCKNDLCKNESYDTFDKALKNIESYKKEHNIKP